MKKNDKNDLKMTKNDKFQQPKANIGKKSIPGALKQLKSDWTAIYEYETNKTFV